VGLDGLETTIGVQEESGFRGGFGVHLDGVVLTLPHSP
jgi:hypothetical protein